MTFSRERSCSTDATSPRWILAICGSAFAVVLQDVFLFSGTLESNIRLGSDIPRERILAAARDVNLMPFIESLPDGLEHEVNERGTTLSAGQRQLLAFARALAHDPQVLILDEATSSVDTETEIQIRQAIDRVDGGTDVDRHRAPAFHDSEVR